MPTTDKRICVFTGSSPGADPAYRAAATAFAREMVARGYELVFGGGKVGLMGAVADAVIEAGGRATGIIPRALMGKEIAHERLDRLEIVTSMHERKHRMAELASVFVALPGGMGTLEELSEVATWAQLGIHSKPCGVLNVNGFYDALLSHLDHAVRERFVRPEHRALLQVAQTPEALLDLVESYQPVHIGKWMDLEET